VTIRGAGTGFGSFLLPATAASRRGPIVEIPTIEVTRISDSVSVVINADDFDPKLHQRADETPPKRRRGRPRKNEADT